MFAWAAPRRAARGGRLNPVPLPSPQTDGGKPLMRRWPSGRPAAPSRRADPGADAIEPALGGLGVNRPAEGKRTAPSGRNRQEIDLLISRSDGPFLYDAKANRLLPVEAGDHRTLTGTQSFVKTAPRRCCWSRICPGYGGREKTPSKCRWPGRRRLHQPEHLPVLRQRGLATGVRASIDRPRSPRRWGLNSQVTAGAERGAAGPQISR